MTGVQLELPIPQPRARPAARYVVEVNECGIFASRRGIEFWTTGILSRPIGQRLAWLFMGPGGGLAHLPCAGKEEAEFIHGQLLAHGIHTAHARVRRLAPEKKAAQA